jgi:hypothetical protein
MTLPFPDDLHADRRAAAEAVDAELHHDDVMAIARDVIEGDAEILRRLATA